MTQLFSSETMFHLGTNLSQSVFHFQKELNTALPHILHIDESNYDVLELFLGFILPLVSRAEVAAVFLVPPKGEGGRVIGQ